MSATSPPYLVTGAAGFLGSHVVDALVARGCRVVAVDTDRARWERHAAAHAGSEEVRFVCADVCDQAVVEPLVAGAKAVLHLASAVGVGVVMERGASAGRGVVEPAMALLSYAAPARVRTLLASSSEVYGIGAAQEPLSEAQVLRLPPPVRPRWIYAYGKAFVEALGFGYAREHGLPVMVARIFNAVGPRQDGATGMVLPRFVSQAREGCIRVYGHGGQRRRLCDVTEIAGGLIDLLDCDRAVGQTVNLAGTVDVSIAELAEAVRQVVNPRAGIAHVPPTEVYGDTFDEVVARRPQLEKARELIGWRPQTGLEDIIRSVAAQPT